MLDELYSETIQITKKFEPLIEDLKNKLNINLPFTNYFVFDAEFNKKEELYMLKIRDLKPKIEKSMSLDSNKIKVQKAGYASRGSLDAAKNSSSYNNAADFFASSDYTAEPSSSKENKFRSIITQKISVKESQTGNEYKGKENYVGNKRESPVKRQSQYEDLLSPVKTQEQDKYEDLLSPLGSGRDISPLVKHGLASRNMKTSTLNSHLSDI